MERRLNPSPNRSRLGLLLLAGVALSGCEKKPGPTVTEEPRGSAKPASVIPAPSGSATLPTAEGQTIPTLVATRLPGADYSIHAVENGLAAVDGLRVGRVTEKGVEWAGRGPPGNPDLGDNIITAVHGRWPDRVGVVYTTGSARASQPTYWPISGKAVSHTMAPGGGVGAIIGVVDVGESTLMVGYSWDTSVEITLLRGPPLLRKQQTLEQAGCKRAAMPDRPPPPAVMPRAVGATPEGTMIALGGRCDENRIVAEVWEKSSQSRLVDLGHLWKKLSWRARFVAGTGDEVWIANGSWNRIVHYKDGRFEAAPDLGVAYDDLFLGPGGKLLARVGKTYHRLSEAGWAPAYQAEGVFHNLVTVDDTIWAGEASSAVILREGPKVPAPPPVLASCTTPFVYLYAASSNNGPKFTYPSTRKALSTFAGVEDLGLVEFVDDSQTHLGITVKSREQAEAVAAHVKATMADEDPRIYCYAPRAPRKIDMAAAPGK